MNAMIDLEGPDVEFTLFRGTKEELKAAAGVYCFSPVCCTTRVLVLVRRSTFECIALRRTDLSVLPLFEGCEERRWGGVMILP